MFSLPAEIKQIRKLPNWATQAQEHTSHFLPVFPSPGATQEAASEDQVQQALSGLLLGAGLAAAFAADNRSPQQEEQSPGVVLCTGS